MACVFDSREAAEALDFYTRLSAEKWTDAEGKVRRGYSSKDAGELVPEVGARRDRHDDGVH